MAKKKAGVADPTTQVFDLSLLPIANPTDVKPVYANNGSTNYGPHDFRIIFSEIVTSSLPGVEPTVELRANVAMAPTHFKALVDAMARTLALYESHFGKVVWPPKENAPRVKM